MKLTQKTTVLLLMSLSLLFVIGSIETANYKNYLLAGDLVYEALGQRIQQLNDFVTDRDPVGSAKTCWRMRDVSMDSAWAAVEDNYGDKLPFKVQYILVDNLYLYRDVHLLLLEDNISYGRILDTCLVSHVGGEGTSSFGSDVPEDWWEKRAVIEGDRVTSLKEDVEMEYSFGAYIRNTKIYWINRLFLYTGVIFSTTLIASKFRRSGS